MTHTDQSLTPASSHRHADDRVRGRSHQSVRALVAAGVSILMAMLAMIAGAGAVAAAPAMTTQSVTTDAKSAQKQAIALRKDVKNLLTSYTNEYADRFTSTELAQLNGYRDDADRQLASVVVTTSRLARVASKKGPQRSLDRAQAAALKSWTRAKGAAQTSWEKARVITEPSLGLFERIKALNDYNAMMTRFDTLGDTLRDLGD